MKKELLEYLVRHCVKEVLAQVSEGDSVTGPSDFYKDEKGYWCKKCGSQGKKDSISGKITCIDSRCSNSGKIKLKFKEVEDPTQGAPAPPEAGQGTADQAGIPSDKDTSTDTQLPSEPETPPVSPDIKGIQLINPKDKARLEKVTLQGKDDATLERELHKIGAQRAGSRIKVAISTIRMVKDALRNPNTATYLYFGKYDPNSDEVFLMADKSLQVAKDSSVPSTEILGTPVTQVAPPDFDPLTANTPDFTQHVTTAGKPSPKYGIDETLSKTIKKIVNEILDKK